MQGNVSKKLPQTFLTKVLFLQTSVLWGWQSFHYYGNLVTLPVRSVRLLDIFICGWGLLGWQRIEGGQAVKTLSNTHYWLVQSVQSSLRLPLRLQEINGTSWLFSDIVNIIQHFFMFWKIGLEIYISTASEVEGMIREIDVLFICG